MQTTKDIDQDVVTLHEELDRHDGKQQFHCNKRCKRILGVVGLVLFMFLFGVLTRPSPQIVVVPEVALVSDATVRNIERAELDQHLSLLHATAQKGGALVPALASVVTEPRILTWTPTSIGKKNGDGSLVPVEGSYALPKGWFGIIRLLVDGKEISAVAVDSRALSASGEGRFSLPPPTIIGEHTVRIALDAVQSCRITCAPTDQLCRATNVNFCGAQSDNQAFLAYIPAVTESFPPKGQCVTKLFMAGPKYTPQAPEDYTMCQKGMWNTDLSADIQEWLVSAGVEPREMTEAITALTPLVQTPSAGTPPITGGVGSVTWTVTASHGDAETERSCVAKAIVSVNCTK